MYFIYDYVLFIDGDKEKSEAIIMERLVAFCDIQSSKNESEPMESPNHIK